MEVMTREKPTEFGNLMLDEGIVENEEFSSRIDAIKEIYASRYAALHLDSEAQDAAVDAKNIKLDQTYRFFHQMKDYKPHAGVEKLKPTSTEGQLAYRVSKRLNVSLETVKNLYRNETLSQDDRISKLIEYMEIYSHKEPLTSSESFRNSLKQIGQDYTRQPKE